MHHGTCVKHVPWCMSGLLTRGGGKNVPGIPDACAPAIWRIWQEAHGSQRLQCCRCSSRYPWTVSPSYGSRISECTQTESWDDNPRDQNWSSRLNTIHFCCRPKDHRSHPVDKEGVIITIKNTLLSFSLIKHAVKWFTKNYSYYSWNRNGTGFQGRKAQTYKINITLIHVASFTKEVYSRLAKRPFVFNWLLANRGLTSLVKEATGDYLWLSGMVFSKSDVLITCTAGKGWLNLYILYKYLALTRDVDVKLYY